MTTEKIMPQAIAVEATTPEAVVTEASAMAASAKELAAQELAACVDAAFPLPSLLFVLGALSVLLYLKRKHRLSLVKVFKAMVGVDRVPHDKVSTTLMIVTLLVPLGLWVVLGARCG
ncbi:hypothetical protein MHM39_07135 [Phaeobacter sp. CNT1-3]|nr:hypothetical protein [Phaeobacter sp. CNT1-3]